MTRNILARLETLERATRTALPRGPVLRVCFMEGASAEHVTALERAALAQYVAQHGEPRGQVGFCHRTIIEPKHRVMEAAHA